MAVAQCDVAAAVLGYLRIVGHEYDGTSLGMQFLEKNQYLERGTGIEISGRFIGEDDGAVLLNGFEDYGYEEGEPSDG